MIPKPPPHLPKAERYRMWKQMVALPHFYLGCVHGTESFYNSKQPNVVRFQCKYCLEKHVEDSVPIPEGYIELLERPTERGEWWHLEGLVIDHVQPRAHRPDLVFDIDNCVLACPECNRNKGGSHE